MLCVYTEIQLLLNKTTPHFSFYLCLRLTSPNYAFMRNRFYSKQKVFLCLSVSLSLGTIDWSMICYCGISCSYTFEP